MDNIFDTNNLYPGYESKLKQHFGHYFDNVFIAFSPFFHLNKNEQGALKISPKNTISLTELQEKDHTFKNLKPFDGRVIYTQNPNYPTDEEIIKDGIIVPWQYVLEHGGFSELSEINLALRTSIGALRDIYKKEDLNKILDDFTIKNGIFHPTEGRITILSLMKIYHCLTAIGKLELIVTDEFFYGRKTLNISEFTCSEFILKVRGYMYFFPIDRSLLFTIDWDSFFFLICGDQDLLHQIIPKFEFEGFYCNDETMHNWDFKEL
ncbi:hypothetical protein DBR11_24150 [Pedobacter sp. HMWF019]|uniref:DUF2711 family protein n=1 Tax=Pedobacter sp. HMWF019 TaxID=2056856 RepID=UPI000D36906F|nr:DUF2711 family protein [Pedobacter sp. HMWF019]PTS94094.1 hypothetical protein DBR11_24150 [Pedobacter sp. HMWF019]